MCKHYIIQPYIIQPKNNDLPKTALNPPNTLHISNSPEAHRRCCQLIRWYGLHQIHFSLKKTKKKRKKDRTWLLMWIFARSCVEHILRMLCMYNLQIALCRFGSSICRLDKIVRTQHIVQIHRKHSICKLCFVGKTFWCPWVVSVVRQFWDSRLHKNWHSTFCASNCLTLLTMVHRCELSYIVTLPAL